MHLIIWVMAALLVCFVAARVYYALTDDFRLSNITYDMPYEENWSIAAPSSVQETQLEQILNQPFFYLGKGAQSYAFASQNDRYVIKFFKFKHLRPSWFVDMLPPVSFLKTYKEKQSARKARKLFGVFNSYKLAFDVDRDESGLIFIQLNTTKNPKRQVTVIDKIGFKHRIELDSVPFIVQYKGETLRTVLARLLDQQDVETAKQRINQILNLYVGEYRKGIFDHDHGVMQNTGFVGDKPIHLDVGKLLKEEKMRDPAFAKKDLLLVAQKIKEWIKTRFPDYYSTLSEFIDAKISQLYP